MYSNDSPFPSLLAADVRQFVDLFNLAGPDFTAQDENNQVVRYSITNGGPPVAVAGTVNTDPRAWVNNCAPKQPCDGDAALRLSQQVSAVCTLATNTPAQTLAAGKCEKPETLLLPC